MHAFHDVSPRTLGGSARSSGVDGTGEQGGGAPLFLALVVSVSNLTSNHRAGIAARILSSTMWLLWS